MRQGSFRPFTCLYLLIAAVAASAQGTYKLLPSSFVPTRLSADGNVVVGQSGNQPAYYSDAAGLKILTSPSAEGAIAVSGNGEIIIGTSSIWRNGVRSANTTHTIDVSDDGLNFLHANGTQGYLVHPSGTVQLESGVSYGLQFNYYARWIVPDGSTAIGEWTANGTVTHGGGLIYEADGRGSQFANGYYVGATTYALDHMYIRAYEEEGSDGQPHYDWLDNNKLLMSLFDEQGTIALSCARDNSIASDGKTIYLPYRNALLPLATLLSEFGITNVTTGLSDVTLLQISRDGLTLLGQGKDGNNVVKYWLARLDLHGRSDHFEMAPNTSLNQPASGVLANDIFSLGASCVLVNSTSHGTLQLNIDGSFTYTPATNFLGGDTFTYKLQKGAVASAPITVVIRVGVPASITGPATIGAGGKGTGSVTLNFTTFKDETVALKSSRTNVATVPASVVVHAGASTASFTITGAAITTSAHTTLSATYNGVSRSTDLLVAASSPKSLTFDQPSYCGGNGTSPVGVVVLWSKAPSTGLTVNLVSSNPNVLSVPATVRIGAGYLSNKFAATTYQVPSPTQVTVTASANGTTTSATVTVRLATLKSASFPNVVRSGQTAPVTVYLDGVLTYNNSYRVDFLISGSSVGSLYVPGGQSSATEAAINVPVVAQETTYTVLAQGQDGTTYSFAMTVESAVLIGFTGRTPTINGGLTAIADLHYDGKPAKVQPVTYASSNTAVIPTPGKTGGAMAKSIPTNPVSTTYDVTVSATFEGVTQSYVQRVIPAQLDSLVVTPNQVKGGTHITGSVQLLGTAAASARVGLNSSDPSAIPLPASTSVPAGKSVQTFDIPTNPVSSNTTVTITATYKGIQRTAVVTVTP